MILTQIHHLIPALMTVVLLSLSGCGETPGTAAQDASLAANASGPGAPDDSEPTVEALIVSGQHNHGVTEEACGQAFEFLVEIAPVDGTTLMEEMDGMRFQIVTVYDANVTSASVSVDTTRIDHYLPETDDIGYCTLVQMDSVTSKGDSTIWWQSVFVELSQAQHTYCENPNNHCNLLLDGGLVVVVADLTTGGGGKQLQAGMAAPLCEAVTTELTNLVVLRGGDTVATSQTVGPTASPQCGLEQ